LKYPNVHDKLMLN